MVCYLLCIVGRIETNEHNRKEGKGLWKRILSTDTQTTESIALRMLFSFTLHLHSRALSFHVNDCCSLSLTILISPLVFFTGTNES